MGLRLEHRRWLDYASLTPRAQSQVATLLGVSSVLAPWCGGCIEPRTSQVIG